MLRGTRARLREKLGRALDDYVMQELRGRAAAQAEATAALREDVSALGRLLDETRADLRGAEERLADAMRAWERRQRRDLLTVTDIEGAQTSAAFLRREMDLATAHFSPRDTLTSALKVARPEGLFLEFGVASGATLRTITELAPSGSVYGFDSFEGLPEHWRSGFGPGAFAQDALPDVPGAELVVGLFDATLPGFLDAHPEPVAFVHVDADLYSSTVAVLDLLESRMRPGTVLVFDEYFNFPDWEQHEHRAWTEFVARTGIEFEYLGFTADDEQVSMRVTRVPGQES